MNTGTVFPCRRLFCMLRSCQNPQTAKNGPNRRLRRATHRFLRRSRRTEIHRVNFSDLHFLPPFCRLFLWKKHRLFRDCSRRFSFILSYPDAASSSFFLPATMQSPVTFPHPSGSFAAEYRYVHTRKDGGRFSNKRRPSSSSASPIEAMEIYLLFQKPRRVRYSAGESRR